MKKLYLLFILGISFSLQAQDILWEKSYGGTHGDYLLDAIPTPDYGFILAGSSVSDNTGNKKEKNRGHLDYWLWKMDEHGSLVWEKDLGGSGVDILNQVVATRDGGFLLAGSSTSPADGDKKDASFGGEDYWVIKLHADGTEQWQKTLGGVGNDQLITAIELPDGGYLLAGSSDSPASAQKELASFGNVDFWLIQLSAEGTVEWETTLGGSYRDAPKALAALPEKGLYVLGHSNSNEGEGKQLKGKGSGDFWLVHLDFKGTKLWEKVYGGEADDLPTTMAIRTEGGLWLGGVSNSSNTGNKQTQTSKGTDFWLLAIDEEGIVLDEYTYNIGEYDVLTSMVTNRDGSLLLGGYAKSEKMGKKMSDKKGINDYVALKIDVNGEVVWKQELGSNGNDYLQRVFKTRDGGYLLAGTSNGNVSRNKNGKQGLYDFWLVKLGDEDNDDDEGANLVEAYPNPTSGFTNIVITEPFETGEAFLFDIQGRFLAQYPLTDRTLPINLAGLPIGVYLVNIDTDTVQSSVKIIKKD